MYINRGGAAQQHRCALAEMAVQYLSIDAYAYLHEA